jgi:hypothetical protein
MSQFNKYIKIAQEMINEGEKINKTIKQVSDTIEENLPEMILEKLKEHAEKLGFYDNEMGIEDLTLGFYDNDHNKNFYDDVKIKNVLKKSIVVQNPEDKNLFTLKLTKKHDFTTQDDGNDVLEAGDEILIEKNLIEKIKEELSKDIKEKI